MGHNKRTEVSWAILQGFANFRIILLVEQVTKANE
jgi:hypothetical protein